MGKGERNRQRRRGAPDPGALLDRLFDIEERDLFLALVEGEPEILGEKVGTRLSQMTAAPPGLVFRPWQRLLNAARRDPSAAWEIFSREMAHHTEIAEKLAAVFEDALRAERDHQPARAIDLAERAIPEALEAENAPLAAETGSLLAAQSYSSCAMATVRRSGVSGSTSRHTQAAAGTTMMKKSLKSAAASFRS